MITFFGALNSMSNDESGSLMLKSESRASVPLSGITLSGDIQIRGAPSTSMSLSVYLVLGSVNSPIMFIVA